MKLSWPATVRPLWENQSFLNQNRLKSVVSATLAAKPGMQSTIARTRTVASTLLHVFFMKNPSNRFGTASKSVPFLWLHYIAAARNAQSPLRYKCNTFAHFPALDETHVTIVCAQIQNAYGQKKPAVRGIRTAGFALRDQIIMPRFLASKVSSSRKSGCAMAISWRARSPRLRPRRCATPYSVTM